MAKLTLNTIGSRYGSIDALNDNFNAIEQAIENTFSLDGTSPNALEADLDMNSNDILNAGEVSTDTLRINGVLVEPTTGVTAGAAFQTYEFTATAGQTSFSVSPATPYNASIVVIVNGLQLSPAEVSVSGTNVITPALTLGDEVVIRRYTAEPVASPDASEVNFIQAGVGAVTRTSQDKMREWVSVIDFGADPTGGIDSSSAFSAAIAAADNVFIPVGTYRCTIVLSGLSGKTLRGAGRYSTFLKNAGSSAVITMDNTTTPTQLNRVCDMAIVNANESTYPNTDGIVLSGVEANQHEWHNFENLWIQDFRRGVSVTGRLIWTNFSNIHFFSCVNGLHAVTDHNVSQLAFRNCRFGSNTEYGVYAEKTANDSFSAWHFDACTFELNGRNGFRSAGAVGFSGLKFTACYFEENAGSISAGGTNPRKANIFIDSALCIGLAVDACAMYGNSTSTLDWNIYVTSTTASGRIGPNRTGTSTNGFVNLPAGFVVDPQDGNNNDLTLAAGSFDARQTEVVSTAVMTLTGCTTSPTGTARFVRQGKVVTAYFPVISGTSNTTAATLTGLPTALYPTRDQTVPCLTRDATAGLKVATATIGTSGVVTLFTDAGGGGFANTGTKGILLQTLSWSLE